MPVHATPCGGSGQQHNVAPPPLMLEREKVGGFYLDVIRAIKGTVELKGSLPGRHITIFRHK